MRAIHRSPLLAGLITTVALSAGTAFAGNAVVEDAITSRSDLSQFKLALEKTGVINEIQSGSYTIFAPTNDAFAKLTQKDYPCLYSPQCTEEVAAILRNHIVKGEVHVSDVATRGGAVFSLDKTHLHIAEPHKGEYTVDGHKIESQNQLAGSVLYKIDGLIADKDEVASLKQLKPVAMAPAVIDTNTDRTVTKQYRYRADGQPATATQSTVTRTTTVTTPPAQIAPASGY